jgi:hypothetical protein
VSGPSWASLGPSWAMFGSSWPSWGHIRPSYAILNYLGAFLGPSGASSGPSWPILEPSWSHLGAILEPSWGHLGPKIVQEEAHARPRKARHSFMQLKTATNQHVSKTYGTSWFLKGPAHDLQVQFRVLTTSTQSSTIAISRIVQTCDSFLFVSND